MIEFLAIFFLIMLTGSLVSIFEVLLNRHILFGYLFLQLLIAIAPVINEVIKGLE